MPLAIQLSTKLKEVRSIEGFSTKSIDIESSCSNHGVLQIAENNRSYCRCNEEYRGPVCSLEKYKFNITFSILKSFLRDFSSIFSRNVSISEANQIIYEFFVFFSGMDVLYTDLDSIDNIKDIFNDIDQSLLKYVIDNTLSGSKLLKNLTQYVASMISNINNAFNSSDLTQREILMYSSPL